MRLQKIDGDNYPEVIAQNSVLFLKGGTILPVLNNDKLWLLIHVS